MARFDEPSPLVARFNADQVCEPTPVTPVGANTLIASSKAAGKVLVARSK